jgi:DNA-binding winged helix-turn-helix (wHTH) protein/tetratricopeptide (TPR) repeat protein
MTSELEIVFEPFRLDVVNQCLWREGKSIPLPPKEFSVLLYLVRRAGRLVTKEELIEAVWPDAAVGDGVLKVSVRKLRSALDDDSKAPRFIETSHRRGYRFVGSLSRPQPRSQRRAGDSGRLASLPPLRFAPTRSVELVGREPALAKMRTHLERALDGDRQIVFVTGEAGIGKTTLVEAFMREAAMSPRVWVSRGQCLEQYGAGEAYLPVLEAMSRLCQEPGKSSLVSLLRRRAPTWLQQMPWLVRDNEREELQRAVIGATPERMLREMAEALEALTAEIALVLVLEDLHWSDYSTLDLVSYMARRREPAQLLVIATYRPVDVAVMDHPLKQVKQELQVHRRCDELQLEDLGEEAIRAYLDVRFHRHALPSSLPAILHARTDGNPFFLVNAVDYLQEGGMIAEHQGVSRLTVELADLEIGVPETIRQMIDKQFDRLDRPQQLLLEAAAVAGVEFPTVAIAAVTEQSVLQVEEECEDLVRRHLFLRSAGTNALPNGTVTARYNFVHALYHEVLYERVAPGRRARLHKLIGEKGEEVYGEEAIEVASELAVHFEEGHDFRRAVKYLRLAAENHFLRYANREALAFLERASRLVEQWPDHERVDARMSILFQSGLARRAMGDMVGASQDFERLAAFGRNQGRPADEVEALTHLSTALSWIDRERCLATSERLLDLTSSITDELVRAHVSGCRGYWHVLFLGWGDEHAAALEGAVAACRQAGDHERLGLHLARQSFFDCLRSHYSRGVSTAEESARLSLEVSDAHSYCLSQYYEAWALLHLGRWGEMRRILDHGIEMAVRNEHRRWEVLFRLELGWLHMEAFDFETARDMCSRAYEQAKRVDIPYAESLAQLILGLSLLGMDRHDAAYGYLSEVAQRLDRDRVLMDWILRLLLHHGLSRYWLARRDLSKAKREAERALAMAALPGERTYVALAHLGVAEVEMKAGDWKSADSVLGQALAAIDGLEAPLAAWRVHLAAAHVCEKIGRAADATLHRRRSLEVINRLAKSLEEADRLRSSLLTSEVIKNLEQRTQSNSQ